MSLLEVNKMSKNLLVDAVLYVSILGPILVVGSLQDIDI